MTLTAQQLTEKGFILFPWGYVRKSPESPLIRFASPPKEKYWVEMGNGFRINLETVEKLDTLLSLCSEG